MKCSVHDIAGWIDASAVHLQGSTHIVHHLCIDNRYLADAPHTLFVAFKGAHTDGHCFVKNLYGEGVRVFVVALSFDESPYEQAVFFKVRDVERAMQQIATAYRETLSATKVVGITGSNGKTIVKEWLAKLLKDQHKTIQSPKSYNSQIGVPLSICGIEEEHEIALIEAGISNQGEMERLALMVKPQLGIFTHSGPAHDSGFVSREEKIIEKIGLFSSCTQIVCPPQSEALPLLRKMYPSKEIITWENNTVAEGIFTIEDMEEHSMYTTFFLRNFDGSKLHLRAPFTDAGHIENWLTCVATLRALGIDITKIKETLQTLEPISMRLEMLHVSSDCTLINDTYSADIESLTIAVDFLKKQSHHHACTVILSDMQLSVQADNDALYSTIAKKLKFTHPRLRLICIGKELAKKLLPFFDEEFPHIYAYSTTEDFIAAFHNFSFSDEAILIKGARQFRLERIIPLFDYRTHGTVLEVNLSALRHNFSTFRRYLPEHVKIMGMVKAFGYGSGDYEVAQTLQSCGIDYLSVAYADEGVLLRKSGIDTPIMLMSPSTSSLPLLLDYDLEPVVCDVYFLKHLIAYTKQHLTRNKKMFVHLEVETGMHRLGIQRQHLTKVCSAIASSSTLEVRSVFSHLSSSDAPGDDAYTYHQIETFRGFIHEIQSSFGKGFITHIANSSATIRLLESHFDMVRLGIGLYGYKSTSHMDSSFREVLTFRTDVALIMHLKKGDRVGYGNYTLTKDTVVATIRIGYADGFFRSLGFGKGCVFIRGEKANVLGNVCMDMTMVDISTIEGVRVGDSVEIFGEHMSLVNFANVAGAIPYEVMTHISPRVKRVYIQE